ncbi:hypothetical protein SKAU_G00228820 [Synaphobranchus kaupii]|uniref:Uncharacterized protein n=1 Tax=Synaphobranchus kaupii TaxID=118154 RepID=A0A9Q1F579_SYNKA|nr:hypothetical protein SKAU_G00228820 [Synaphobranchus kaupii]
MLSALMRRWLNRPKRSDTRPLARFFFADEEVTRVTMELNTVDLRKDPQKYLMLLNRLRVSQDQMLRSIELVMDDCIPAQRQSRDYHVKFPDEILHENLGVQLWFAAECLSAGSFLEVREVEGQRLRPLAEQMLQCLEEGQDAPEGTEPGGWATPTLRPCAKPSCATTLPTRSSSSATFPR